MPRSLSCRRLPFVSPEEALVQSLLWLSLAAAMPLALLIAANLLTGRDPAAYGAGCFAPIMAVQTGGTVSPEQSFMACAVETAT
jgi:hypothetical protein